MEPIVYLDRKTQKKCVEKVFGGQALKFLYGKGMFSHCFGKPLAYLLARFSFFSAGYGYLQRLSFTKKKVKPFIREFEVDPSEFLLEVDQYSSFNDFFIRQLKKEARPIVADPTVAVMPADGRYYFYQSIKASDGFIVKGQKFDLSSLLKDQKLAQRYAEGAMVMARLCPSDYHRFHFPCACVPGPSQMINGKLYSVNPIAVKQNIEIFVQNKRCITSLKSDLFGEVLFIEIGATNVGSIHQTYDPAKPYPKGAEKGFFSFGGSSLILLFEPGRILIDQDLLAASKEGLEIRCLMGQSLGKAIKI
jgi:phosphatidylserine decarboxylase